jgi:hypothetical protein
VAWWRPTETDSCTEVEKAQSWARLLAPPLQSPRSSPIRPRFAVLLVAASLFTAGMAQVGSATTVRSLVTTRVPIDAFVQDGGRIAWSVRLSPMNGPTVWVRTLSSGSMDASEACSSENGAGGVVRALAASRAIFDCWFLSKHENFYWALYVAGGDGVPTLLQGLGEPRWGGEVLGPAAGDGVTLVYSTLDHTCTEYATCTFVGGAVKRVRGGSAATLPGVPPSAVLAAASGRIALAPAALGLPRIAPVENGPVEIRNASTGSLIRNFAPVGTVRALALSRSIAAVLVADAAGKKRIERYALATGALLGSTPVSSATVAELDLAGTRIVFRTGRTIRLLDARSGRTRRLLTTGARPIGLSIEGRRVAWAVNRRFQGRGSGRIQSITLNP